MARRLRNASFGGVVCRVAYENCHPVPSFTSSTAATTSDCCSAGLPNSTIFCNSCSGQEANARCKSLRTASWATIGISSSGSNTMAMCRASFIASRAHMQEVGDGALGRWDADTCIRIGSTIRKCLPRPTTSKSCDTSNRIHDERTLSGDRRTGDGRAWLRDWVMVGASSMPALWRYLSIGLRSSTKTCPTMRYGKSAALSSDIEILRSSQTLRIQRLHQNRMLRCQTPLQLTRCPLCLGPRRSASPDRSRRPA